MDDSDYDAAIRQEAALLDKQLAQYVIDALAARQLGGEVALSANVTAAIDAAFVNAAKKYVPETANTAPSERSPMQRSAFDNVPDQAESAISPVQVPGQSGGELPTDPEILNKDVSLEKVEPPADRPKLPTTHVAVLLLLFAAIGFGAWQTIRATDNQAVVEAGEKSKNAIKDVQTDLDKALCSAGYPAVIRTIKAKRDNNEDQTDTEKTVSLFYNFRQDVAKANGAAVAALPVCAAEDEGQ